MRNIIITRSCTYFFDLTFPHVFLGTTFPVIWPFLITLIIIFHLFQQHKQAHAHDTFCKCSFILLSTTPGNENYLGLLPPKKLVFRVQATHIRGAAYLVLFGNSIFQALQ